MIKGGGAALTREKIVADLAERFVCIADETKLVQVLGALSAAGRGDPDGARRRSRARFAALGGRRAGCAPACVTDNGHQILDVRGLTHRRPAGDGGRDQPVAGRGDGAASSRATGRACACSAARTACGAHTTY